MADGWRHWVYRAQQWSWSRWLEWRHRAEFERVEAVCLFVGYPRSGHSVVGALLNAHRDAVVSHELLAHELILAGCSRNQLYARILARAAWFHLRGNTSNYRYQVPGQWQGRFQTLRVLGDKRGGAVSRCIAEHPDFFERVRRLVGVPLRLIHVIRNPFDNISAIHAWHNMPLEASIDYYFQHCESTSRLDSLCAPEELYSLRHEEFLREPAQRLAELCGFLGLPLYPGYLDDCRAILFEKPTRPRHKLDWTPERIRSVEARMLKYRFLDGYAFDA